MFKAAVALLFTFVAYAWAADLTFRRLWTGRDIPNCCISPSPDGGRLAFIRSGSLFVRDRSSGAARQIVTPREDDRANGTPVWSPDGAQIAYWSAPLKRLMTVGQDGERRREVARSIEDGTWSPKGWSAGRILVRTNSGKLLWIGLYDAKVQPVDSRSAIADDVVLSPDGRYLVYSTRAEIHLMTAGGADDLLVSKGPPGERAVGWTNDGKHLLTLRGAALWAIPIGEGRPKGPARLLYPNLATQFHAIPSATVLGTTARGLVYRAITSSSDIYTAELDRNGNVVGQPLPLPLSGSGFNVLPRWAPDGNRLLFHRVYSAPAENIVYALDAGTEQRVATDIPGAAFNWGDGDSILITPFVGGRELYKGLVRVNLKSHQVTPLTRPGDPFSPSAAANQLMGGNTANSIAYFTPSGIHLRNIETWADTEVYRFPSAGPATIPAISHDGRLVAFTTRRRSGSSELMVVPSSGGEPKSLVLLNDPVEFQFYFGIAWSPDDREIFFVKRPATDSAFELCRVPVGGGPKRSAGLKLPDLRDIDISGDGRRIAFSLGAVGSPEIWILENFVSDEK